MILTEKVTYRKKLIPIRDLRPCSAMRIMVQCPECKGIRYGYYWMIKDNQICHICALKKQRKYLNLNEKYGMYTVISHDEVAGRSICKCDCGIVRSISNYELTSGKSKSCGCRQGEIAREFLHKIRKNPTGKDHPNWKGGISGERALHDAKQATKEWRKSVYERDKYTCRKCGQVGYQLNGHHILPYAENPNDRLNIDNGITLCINCHIQFHKQYGRKSIGYKEINEYTFNLTSKYFEHERIQSKAS